jgi:uncharacterized protein (TIGR02391 family)
MESNVANNLLELMHDVLRLFANFEREMGAAETSHNFHMSKLESVVSQVGTAPFLQSLTGLSPETQIAFISLLAQLAQMGREFQNPLGLEPTDKIAFANKLDEVAKGLEKVVGVGKVVTKPTDIDLLLIEKCANKDYHDTVTNAFTILEDKLRKKLGVDRNDYFGEKLIDYAFNPSNGKLILGVSQAEQQGIYFLFKGSFLFLRNPPSHTQSIAEDRNAALKVLHTSDLLIKLIDKAGFRP